MILKVWSVSIPLPPVSGGHLILPGVPTVILDNFGSCG